MVESETELPRREAKPVPVWLPRHQVSQMAGLARRGIAAVLGNLPFDRLRIVGSYAKGLAEKALIQQDYSRMLRWITAGVGDGPWLNRFALHLVVVFLAVGVVAFSQVRIPQAESLLPMPTAAPDLGEHTVAAEPSSRGGPRVVNNPSNVVLVPAPVPHTTIPERERTDVITYTVQANDNMWAIASEFGLQVETLLWANPAVEQNPDLLSVGDVLVVLPIDGLYYTVKSGDTVAKLAKTYKTTTDKILGFPANGLVPTSTLVAGQRLVLPGGQKPVPVYVNPHPLMSWVGAPPSGAPKGSGRFAWPTRGYLSSTFGRGHTGIDIANGTGTAIVAADDGYVRQAGRDSGGYGNMVVIDHGNGYVTRYAHLNSILVNAGDSVKKNQKIGTMGTTGRTTGPHLHFEVLKGGTYQNPLSYLP